MPVFSDNPSYTWSVLSQLWLDQRLADTFLCTATSPPALPPALTSSDKLDFLQDAKKRLVNVFYRFSLSYRHTRGALVHSNIHAIHINTNALSHLHFLCKSAILFILACPLSLCGVSEMCLAVSFIERSSV